jgi:hypothetical protein
MEYVAPRNITVSSVSGRSVAFAKGKPTFAPPQMHAELIAHGIVPATEMPDEPEQPGPKEPVLPEEREAALFKVFERLVLVNRREDFTAVGVPHNAVLARELGWSGMSAKERDAAWTKWNQDRSAT